ncbi:tRNA methyltransferase complex subunit Cpd1 [Rhodotorula toruloides ATCC 204091]|uniref:tRNA (adenine(58)-N(1))-methyltransferase catalytic subunit TRM61 n=1 Tax=Rhodotorula toruloides TaxID=5286 RepID=A0A0K3CRD0_RHOTO|nr:tRNA methyltransferase complex subunit Cpd1 [Rhodotorula toruloides ATCC 204091]KAK4331159.1 tRNA (adenine(58)-N(1))-methyltransferase catalytic subunit TRM61 [Rhodotorula toruloides]PRQ70506.1 tRNA methyltransferase complex subunit Cpd1 [Rhodotorula toruloides]
MTFARDSDTIRAGDWIIVYSSRTSISSEHVQPGKEIQSRYGCFRHNDMLGKPWGTNLASTNGRGFVFLLKPTPELWTQALPHRTQILYLPDIAFITSYLDIKPGSRVIEAGTGSGSFTHALARTVGSKGHVHSFEYHEERFLKAQEEFEQHGLKEVVTAKHRNVYKDGFDGLEDEVDAVFLDLPAPWEALEHAKKAMRKSHQSRICCFSPCIEQVIRTCSTLSSLGFSNITMFETLSRTIDPTPLMGGAKGVEEAVRRIREVEEKKERRREGQIREAKRRREEKRRGNAGAGDPAEPEERLPDADEDAEPDSKRPKPTLSNTPADSPAPTPASNPTQGRKPRSEREFTMKTGAYGRGHTSFLTFAVLLPLEPAQGREREGEATQGKEVEKKGKKDGEEGEKRMEEE